MKQNKVCLKKILRDLDELSKQAAFLEKKTRNVS